MSAKPRATIKASPADFVVDEIPAYEPSGQGDHLFVRFEKTGLTTDAAARAIAEALGADFRNVGIAGMKDKQAITTQWISLLVRGNDVEERAKQLSLDGIRVLEAKRHGNKLKTGHLKGNRFAIVLRNVPADAYEGVVATLKRAGEEGVPNAFGMQRFGKFGDTAEVAKGWLTGKTRAPGNPRLRRFHFSAFQSAIFNAVLEAREADGTWNVPLAGDLLKKEDTGGLFVCTDVQVDRERASRGELCPTGPIYGDRMRAPEGDARALEERIAAPWLEGVDLHRARSLGEGTRRALRLRIDGLSLSEVMDEPPGGPSVTGDVAREQARACTVRFVLPKGAYATTVLGRAVDLGEAEAVGDAASGGSETEES